MKFLLSEMGFKPRKDFPDYKYSDSNKTLERYNLEARRYIILHPFATNPRRSLPEERWVTIIKYLSNFKDLKIVITGSLLDQSVAQEFVRKSSAENNILNLTGVLSMQGLINLIDRANFFIGVDSGITHLASVLGKKSLIIGNYSNPCWLPIYNPNAIILYNTKNCPCAPCNKKYCLRECIENYYRCMMDISQDLIESELKRILS